MMQFAHSKPGGFTLLELLIATSLATLVITGTVRIISAASESYRIQQNLSALQENARFGFNAMQREVTQAGYSPEPWNGALSIAAVSPASVDGANAVSDLLVLNRWSRRNCFENDNPVTDAQGRPAWYLRQNAFSVSAAGTLSHNCRYGPDADSLTTQVNRQGLINDVAALQLLFAEDSDRDGNADHWVRAGHWQNEAGLLAVRMALLLRTPEPIHAPDQATIGVLDTDIAVPADGHLYRLFETVANLQGRLP